MLNNPLYSGKILVAGKNFGSGSSREHAAWALYDYGFRAVVSSFFADIFKNNALNNGILPVMVSPGFLAKILKSIDEDKDTLLTISLEEQTITILMTGETELFEISSHKKHCLLHGLDDIDFLVGMKPEIENFEKQRK